jgi:hypothetical protein
VRSTLLGYSLSLSLVVLGGQGAIAGPSSLHADPSRSAPTQRVASHEPSLYLGVWSKSEATNYVLRYTSTGGELTSLGPFVGAALVAVDRAANLFVADTGADVIYGYARGQTKPFEKLSIPALAGAGTYNTLAVDRQGDFWLALGCGGSYCSVHGSLSEFDKSGNLEQQFSGCLIGYETLAVDAHGDVFSGGTESMEGRDGAKSAIVEYPFGSTTCHRLPHRYRYTHHGGSIQATRMGDLVVDYDYVISGNPLTTVRTYARPSYDRVETKFSVVPNNYVATALISFAQHDTAVWTVDTGEMMTAGLVEYGYPSGDFMRGAEVNPAAIFSMAAVN